MKEETQNEELESEGGYDFSRAVKSPYPELARKKGHRVLDADVRDAFPDSASVNNALRSLLKASGKPAAVREAA